MAAREVLEGPVWQVELVDRAAVRAVNNHATTSDTLKRVVNSHVITLDTLKTCSKQSRRHSCSKQTREHTSYTQNEVFLVARERFLSAPSVG